MLISHRPDFHVAYPPCLCVLLVPDKQTQSFLIKRFKEVGIRPNTKRGQNFLIDLNLLKLLHDSAEIEPCDLVLEVGTGTGALTAMMADLAGAVVTVEIDRRLFQLASEELEGRENVTMLRADILKNKNTLNPAVMETVETQLQTDADRRFKLVSNLPYNVATPIVSNLLACPLTPRTMTITIQKELADRVTASPGTKDYGALSVWVQCQARAHIVRIMPPSVFWPRPKVESAILHIELDDQLRGRIPDLAFFHQFARSMFFHRRKFLRSVAVSAFKNRLTKADVDEVLAEQEIDGTRRTEELDVDTLLALGEAFRSRLPE